MPRKKQPAQRKRLTDEHLTVFGDIFPGFAEWYRANHDAEGRYIGEKLPGLSSPNLLHLAEEAKRQERDGETVDGGFAREEDEE